MIVVQLLFHRHLDRRDGEVAECTRAAAIRVHGVQPVAQSPDGGREKLDASCLPAPAVRVFDATAERSNVVGDREVLLHPSERSGCVRGGVRALADAARVQLRTQSGGAKKMDVHASSGARR